MRIRPERLRRQQLPRLATMIWWAVVIVLTVSVAVALPDQARRLRSDIEVGSSQTRAYRELQPARTVGLADTRVFVTADRVIPRDATFAVVTGPAAAITDPLVLRWVRRFARYHLLPRRLVRRARDADWVISYGRTRPLAGIRAERVIVVAPGIELVEVRSP